MPFAFEVDQGRVHVDVARMLDGEPWFRAQPPLELEAAALLGQGFDAGLTGRERHTGSGDPAAVSRVDDEARPGHALRLLRIERRQGRARVDGFDLALVVDGLVIALGARERRAAGRAAPFARGFEGRSPLWGRRGSEGPQQEAEQGQGDHQGQNGERARSARSR